MCHTFYKDYEKASSYFQKLLHLQPEDALMRTNYGRILALSGQAQKAMEQLTEALRIAEDKNEEQLIEQVIYLFIFRQSVIAH